MFSAFYNNIRADLHSPARHVVNKPAPVTLSDKMLWTETLSLPSITLCLCSDWSDEDKLTFLSESKRIGHCFSFVSLSEVKIETKQLYNSVQTSSSTSDRSVDSWVSQLRQTESCTCTPDMAGTEAPAEAHRHHTGQVSDSIKSSPPVLLKKKKKNVP